MTRAYRQRILCIRKCNSFAAIIIDAAVSSHINKIRVVSRGKSLTHYVLRNVHFTCVYFCKSSRQYTHAVYAEYYITRFPVHSRGTEFFRTSVYTETLWFRNQSYTFGLGHCTLYYMQQSKHFYYRSRVSKPIKCAPKYFKFVLNHMLCNSIIIRILLSARRYLQYAIGNKQRSKRTIHSEPDVFLFYFF